MNKYIISLFTILLLSGNVFATDGASFKIDIFQVENSIEKNHLIYSDTFDIQAGKNRSGFVGPFSLDIELQKADTLNATFDVHLVTLGMPAYTYSNKYFVEYSLPARIEHIEGKNETEYLLLVSPLEFKNDIDTTCNYDVSVKDVYYAKPTAYTDIYYIQSTLGEFYWDSIKELMETNYSLFRGFLHLNIPGKINIFVPPCLTNVVIWDKRFGTSFDPTKNTAYAVYSQQLNTVDPFILNHTATLKTYGYSSPFLSEGLANYFSFGMFEMKKIVNEKRNIPLEQLLQTYDYLTADATIADKTSTTFARYLIDQYSLSNFLELYQQADDINLETSLQQIYKKSVSELEQEWLTYVDTFTIPLKTYITFSRSAEMMMRYDLSHEYLEAFSQLAKTEVDSIKALTYLKRSSFFRGEYQQSLAYQQQLIDKNPQVNAKDWMVLGSYALMLGDTTKAFTSFTKAQELDPNDHFIKFNLALYYTLTGENNKAIELLKSNFSSEKNASAQAETRILLAETLAESKDTDDKALSQKYFQEAVNYYLKVSQTSAASPAVYMWLGRAYLGLKDSEKATNYLLVGRFLESRPFYNGMIGLLLGKAYILANNNQMAKAYLETVVSDKSASYHKDEAVKLLAQLKK